MASPVDLLEMRVKRVGRVDDLLYNANDSYVSVRVRYIHNRHRRVAGGETDVEELPDFFGN